MYFMLEKNEFSYRVLRDNKLGNNPHLHTQVEIIQVTKGECIAFADKKSDKLCTGDLYIAFPNQVHYYLNGKNVEHARIIFSPDICPEFAKTFKTLVPETPVLKNVNSRIINIVNDIIDVDIQKDIYCETELKGLLLLFMCEILRCIKLIPSAPVETDTVKNIINYCYDNYCGEISLESISNSLHISKYHISHLFTSRLNTSFNRYINALRIMRASELLLKEEKTVSEIAYEVGYNSIRTFNRAFITHKNMSPKEYRALKKSRSEQYGEYI